MPHKTSPPTTIQQLSQLASQPSQPASKSASQASQASKPASQPSQASQPTKHLVKHHIGSLATGDVVVWLQGWPAESYRVCFYLLLFATKKHTL
jgi:hypothetical protein